MIPSKRTASAVTSRTSGGGRVAGKPSRREPRARLIHHDGENDRAPDHDPLVVLVEVQRTDRLSNQNDEQRAERGAEGAAASADQAGAADHGRRDHIELVSLRVARRRRSVEARAEKRGESRGETGDDEHADLNALERESGEATRFDVAAEREDVPSHHRASQINRAEDGADEHREHRHWIEPAAHPERRFRHVRERRRNENAQRAVDTKAMPRRIHIVPSVTMNGWTRSPTTSTPLSSPLSETNADARDESDDRRSNGTHRAERAQESAIDTPESA